MQTDAELVDQVREAMASTFGIDESELPENVSQETFGPWTSLHHMTLLLALEEHFGVTFSMEEMPEMTSLPKLVAALKRHGAGASV